MFIYNDLPVPWEWVENQLCDVGYCGLINSPKPMAVEGGITGVTEYAHIGTDFTFANPKLSGTRKISERLVLIKNNHSLMPSRDIIVRYATLLAHADLTLQSFLINIRDMRVLTASDRKLQDVVADYYDNLSDGKFGVIIDELSADSFLGDQSIKSLNNSNNINGDLLLNTLDAQRRILKDFYEDIGIRQSSDKRERETTDEISSNDGMLLFNVSDMLKSRQSALDEANHLFGWDASVDLNPMIGGDIDV